MKKLFTLLAFITFAVGIMAQAPDKMSYQALVRDSNNKLIPDSNIGMQISILQGTASGTAVFVERHFPSTNSNGLVTVEIGSGTVVSGDLTGIGWTNGPYFIKSEIDLKGGANYTITGTSQLLSVPFALHANTVENGDDWGEQVTITDETLSGDGISGSPLRINQQGASTGQILKWDGTSWKPDADNVGSGSPTGKAGGDLVGTYPNPTIGNGKVNSDKILDGTITASDIQDRQRNIGFPANALNYGTSTILTQSAGGIRWQSTYAASAVLIIPKPTDWLESSNVTLKLYFYPITNASGAAAFFIRPRAYNDGDLFADASSLNAESPVSFPANSQSKVYSQSFTIPNSRFGTKSMWLITLQRGGTGETYLDDLVLMTVEIIYTAVQ